MTAPQTRPLAILFADISGSTRLYDTLGDTRALQCVAQCLQHLRKETERHGGHVIKTIGDEIMCAFPDVEQALLAANEMQGRMSATPIPDAPWLALRVGFHFGTVIEEDGDVFGDNVNVAARLTELAKGGQIITSRQTVDALPAYLRTGVRRIETLPIRGKQEEFEVYEVIWQWGDDLTMMQGRPAPVPAPDAGLTLIHGGREIALSPGRPPFAIGRDPHSDLVVADRMASRQHARIEPRRDKFVLVDVSTNGTFVRFEDGEEVFLRREELLLRGSGVLGFGQSTHLPETDLVRFTCG